jgi:hypothetical protein
MFGLMNAGSHAVASATLIVEAAGVEANEPTPERRADFHGWKPLLLGRDGV